MLTFAELAGYWQRIERVAKRLEIISILAELFQSCTPLEAQAVAYLLQGRVRPTYLPVEIGVGSNMVVAALARAFSEPEDGLRARSRELGDAGLLAEQLAESHSQSLSVLVIHSSLLAIAREVGEGSGQRKLDRLAGLFTRMGKLEARYLARIPLKKLRLGVREPTVFEALSQARSGERGTHRRQIERAYHRLPDLGRIAKTYLAGGLPATAAIEIEVGVPVLMASAQVAQSPEEIIGRMQESALEPKYDGLRVQLHRRGREVAIFSRRLEPLTDMFPELVSAAGSQLGESEVILEGEAVAYDPLTRVLRPFQVTSTRRRKFDIARNAEQNPVQIFCFDLLYANGDDLTARPFAERRARLLEIVEPNQSIAVIEQTVTASADAVEKYFLQQIATGLEGIVAKQLDAPYETGKRGFAWMKFKPGSTGLGDTIDCAVIGFWRGSGKRTAFGIGGLLGAVWDGGEQRLKSITRIGSGFSDEQWIELARMLEEDVISAPPALVASDVTPDQWVQPRHVITVQCDEISRSRMHTAGRSELFEFGRITAATPLDGADLEQVSSVGQLAGLFAGQPTGIPLRQRPDLQAVAAVLGYWNPPSEESAAPPELFLAVRAEDGHGWRELGRIDQASFPDWDWHAADRRTCGAPLDLLSRSVPDVWLEPGVLVEVTGQLLRRHWIDPEGGQEGFALRFPRALGLPRPDKGYADATSVAQVARLYAIQSLGLTARAAPAQLELG